MYCIRYVRTHANSGVHKQRFVGVANPTFHVRKRWLKSKYESGWEQYYFKGKQSWKRGKSFLVPLWCRKVYSRTKCCIIFYPLGTHFSIAQMTLQRHIIIIVRDAKFEPGTTVSAIWWASNDPQKKSLILNLNYEQKQIEHCKQNLYYDVQRKTIYLALLIIYLKKLFNRYTVHYFK